MNDPYRVTPELLGRAPSKRYDKDCRRIEPSPSALDRQAAAERAALHQARRADAVIGAALTRRWPGITDAAAATRVTVVSGPGGDTYFLDGVEFLWLGKPVITQNDDGTISVDRQWREAPL